MAFQVKVKWGKERYDVELNSEEPPAVFKGQLFALTGVPPDRQKVMLSGSIIGNDDWGRSASKIKPGCTFLVMGSSEALPSVPTVKTKFVEDLSESEVATALKVPCGLRNLGNTCYMNSTIQCLKAVPELGNALKTMPSTPPSPDTQVLMLGSLQKLYQQMDINQPDLALVLFLQKLHEVVPHFSERDPKSGTYKQQDAHECWQAVVQALSLNLPGEGGAKKNFMEQYFGISLQSSLKCLESPNEPPLVEKENMLQLSCFIQQDIKYLLVGLQLGFKGSIEKLSPTLNRNAQYEKTSKITRLPGYLVIQYVRFFFGRSGASDEVVAKKILKDIKFQAGLDMFEFCAPELQERLLVTRQYFKEEDDRKANTPRTAQKPKEEENVEYEPYDFPDDPGSNNSGFYELRAVLTHQGRSSSSGHYVAWVKGEGKQWLKFDDDVVSIVTEDDVLKLSGGGDWHMAYILVYGPRKLPKLAK